jgi:hypothetical protein
MPGNRRRNSMAADNSPCFSKVVRMAVASSSETMDMVGRMVTNTTAGKLAPALVWGGQDGPDDNRVVMKDGTIQNQTI